MIDSESTEKRRRESGGKGETEKEELGVPKGLCAKVIVVWRIFVGNCPFQMPSPSRSPLARCRSAPPNGPSRHDGGDSPGRSPLRGSPLTRAILPNQQGTSPIGEQRKCAKRQTDKSDETLKDKEYNIFVKYCTDSNLQLQETREETEDGNADLESIDSDSEISDGETGFDKYLHRLKENVREKYYIPVKQIMGRVTDGEVNRALRQMHECFLADLSKDEQDIAQDLYSRHRYEKHGDDKDIDFYEGLDIWAELDLEKAMVKLIEIIRKNRGENPTGVYDEIMGNEPMLANNAFNLLDIEENEQESEDEESDTVIVESQGGTKRRKRGRRVTQKRRTQTDKEANRDRMRNAREHEKTGKLAVKENRDLKIKQKGREN
ncbi:hypothetical protein WR25_17980 [Diploscapter pachys]|uniref:Uncharacterized protein n=1 Tax=Diploscapter pachys TaxID=2018661 RepID=A0A2A2LTG2_9BILA|nr:hypothetical protein WR25_17980 [Diploscapter pachys]